MSASDRQEGPGNVGQFQVLKNMPRMDEALALLKKLHSLCKPIQKKYGWYLPTLCEFFPNNDNLLGMNMNRGQKIFIRLRPAYDKNTFYPLEESLVGTLLHEFTHNLHGPHDKNFYDFLDKLQDEFDALRSGGYTGEGFLSDGKRLGVAHNLPAHLAKAKALEEAERRNKLAKIMGPPGGRTLGGGNKARNAKSPRELMAEAAERRARDAKACGHGDAVNDQAIAKEAQKADDLSQAVNAINLESDEDDEFKLPPPIAAKANNAEAAAVYETESSDDSDLEIISAPPVARPIPSSSSHKHAPATVLGKRPQPPSPGPKASKARPSKQKQAPSTKSEAWTCDICTFSNAKAIALACEVCGSERSSANDTASLADFEDEGAAVPIQRRAQVMQNKKNIQAPDGWTCHRCGGFTEHEYWTCRLCGVLKLSS